MLTHGTCHAEHPELPGAGRELPIVFQDKVFVGPNIAAIDPTWPAYCPNTPGSLWYGHTYEHPRWALGGNGGGGSANNPGPPRSLRRPRVLWRHHAMQWDGIPKR